MARGDSTTLPALSRMPTATLVLPGFAPSTPPPPPARMPRRGGLRRLLALLAVCTAGLVAGGTAAVVERIVTATGEPKDDAPGVDPVQATAVVDTLRPLGRQALASRTFETQIVDDGALPFDENVVYYGVGTVDATLDFALLRARDVRVVESGDLVRVHLPGVVLADPVLDEAQSGVLVDDGDIFSILFPTSTRDEGELRASAIADLAARADASDLATEAARTAVVEVRRRVGPLGARSVDVRFDL